MIKKIQQLTTPIYHAGYIGKSKAVAFPNHRQIHNLAFTNE